MKKVGLIFALVALLMLNYSIASAKKCVKYETEIYACGESWAPADGDPLTKGPWYPFTIFCEREVCVEWEAKSDQPSEIMLASDDDCNCVCAECNKKCGTGHATWCSSYQKPKAQSDTTSNMLASNMFLLCGLSYATVEGDEVTVTGKLTILYMIGGESLGWAVELDSPLEIKGETLNVIEIDLQGKKINLLAFTDGKVKITGRLAKRHGTERGEYWVIEFGSIKTLR